MDVGGLPLPECRVSELTFIDPRQLDMLRDLDPEGAPDLIRELIGIFEEDAPIRMADLRKGLAEGSAEDVSAAAHALKGGVANLGLARLAELARQAENAGRSGDLAVVEGLVAPIEAAIQEAVAALKATL